MPRISPGFRPLFVQIPEILFDKLAAEAAQTRESMGNIVADALRRRYKVAADELPQRVRPGRPPRQGKKGDG